MQIAPTRSALLHLRIPFSFFLLPVFVFALSQSGEIDTTKTILVFIIWHFLIYPASNGYNSYFDKDEGSIALLEKPPLVDKSLYHWSLLLDFTAVLLSFFVGVGFAAAVLVYGLFSKLYSHPRIRLKKYPVISFLIIFIFQGAFVFWTSCIAISSTGVAWNIDFLTAGLVCSCFIGASYPLTQVYQHEEDAKRGDRTLSLMLGVKNSFLFSASLFASGIALLFFYWYSAGLLLFFWIFLLFAAVIGSAFLNWFLKVIKDEKKADFKNMTRMVAISSSAMLIYFTIIWLIS